MDVDHDDGGAAFSGNRGEEMDLQKRKHFDIKVPAVALSLRSLQVPTKEKFQEVMALFWMLTCKVKYYVFCLQMKEMYLLL